MYSLRLKLKKPIWSIGYVGLKICLAIVLTSCLTSKKQANKRIEKETAVIVDTLSWFDKSRDRRIPLAFYRLRAEPVPAKQPVVIFSHGYGQNKGGDYLAYSYLLEKLATMGAFVVSIQHELPTDPLLPSSGIPQIVRRPFWDQGATTILFVIEALKKTNPTLNFKQITLIGHSNGGDMTALFPQKYPTSVHRIITLDNRRMALPRMKRVAVCTIRSSDQSADPGVLPTTREQKRFGITIVQLANTKHDDMDDHANPRQRAEINQWIETFMR